MFGVGTALLLALLTACSQAEPSPAAALPAAQAPTPGLAAMPSTPTPPPTPTPTEIPPPTPEPTPTPTPVDSATVLEEAFRRMDDVESFHFDMDIAITAAGPGFALEVPFRLVGDVARPDRMRAQMEVTLFGFNVESEVTTIGGNAYVLNADTGGWELADEGEAGLLFSPQDLIPSGSSAVGDPSLGDFRSLRFVGEERLDLVDALRFSAELPGDQLGERFEGAEGSLTVGLWVGKDDLLLRRMTMAGRLSPQGEADPLGLGASGEMDFDLLLQISRFDEPVEIVAPGLAALLKPGADLGAPPLEQIYTDPTYGFSISVPSEWRTGVVEGLAFAAIDASSTVDVNVMVEDLTEIDPPMTMEQYVVINAVNAQTTLPDFSRVSWQMATIDEDIHAWEVLFTYGDASAQRVKGSTVFLVRNGQGFSVSAIADEAQYESLAPTMDTILASFTFETLGPPDTTPPPTASETLAPTPTPPPAPALALMEIAAPPVTPEVEWITVQAAIDLMMEYDEIFTIEPSEEANNLWRQQPKGGSPLFRTYVLKPTTVYFYCWDALGTITLQSESVVPCPP